MQFMEEEMFMANKQVKIFSTSYKKMQTMTQLGDKLAEFFIKITTFVMMVGRLFVLFCFGIFNN